ncbi:MAG: hypothetical protein ACLUP7_04945 [Eubacterium sp.]
MSPGPKRPENAGVCIDVAKELGSQKSRRLLGASVDLRAYGGGYYAKQLMHGKKGLKIDNTTTI